MERAEKKRRLELMLEELDKASGGDIYLCYIYNKLFDGSLSKDFPELKPDGGRDDEAWFGKVSELGEQAKKNRQEVLKKWIEHYSDNECSQILKQLVDNVNKHGGSIHGLSIGDELPEDTIPA